MPEANCKDYQSILLTITEIGVPPEAACRIANMLCKCDTAATAEKLLGDADDKKKWDINIQNYAMAKSIAIREFDIALSYYTLWHPLNVTIYFCKDGSKYYSFRCIPDD